MNVKESLKHWVKEENPLVLMRRRKLRKQLTNISPTFICPNCIGGILYHDLGLQFRSPTINTMMHQPEFTRFVLNMDEYLQKELQFVPVPGYRCPCALLSDVIVHFSHYGTPEESEAKWKERITRMDPDNLFVFLEERDGLTREEIERVGKIKAKGLVVFTAHDYSDLPYTVQIKKYEQNGQVGNILKQNYWNGSREYEQYFDFVKWFNEADGGDYNVKNFCK